MTSPAAGARAEVVVVGSLNRDHVCRVEVLPRPGETVLGGEASVGSGGKGGNQAVAAAAAGASTAMVGRVGGDDDGRALLDDLTAAGVDVGAVRQLPGVRSGVAYVLVASDGQNAIAVAPGANGHLDADGAVSDVRRLLSPAGVLVTQAEIPEATFAAVIELAAELGCRAVVNLAPYRPLPPEVLRLCDPLVVNETEAGAVLGRSVEGAAEAVAAARELGSLARSVVVTVGAEGAVVAAEGVLEHVPGQKVEVVDTTGAGDAFTGALAAGLSRGSSLVSAVREGVSAGSEAVRRAGARAIDPGPRTP